MKDEEINKKLADIAGIRLYWLNGNWLVSGKNTHLWPGGTNTPLRDEIWNPLVSWSQMASLAEQFEIGTTRLCYTNGTRVWAAESLWEPKNSPQWAEAGAEHTDLKMAIALVLIKAFGS